jgi:PAS domain S-box-containing protein/TyrR family helix-turn-helix protein
MNEIISVINDLPIPAAIINEKFVLIASNSHWNSLQARSYNREEFNLNIKRCYSNYKEKLSKNKYSITERHKSYNLSFLHISNSYIIVFIIEKDGTSKIKNELFKTRERIFLLETFFENSHDGFWICDGNGNVIDINRAAEALNDIKKEDLIGKNVSTFVRDGYYDISPALRVIQNKKETTVIITSRSGKKLLTTASPVLDSMGKIKYIVENVRDITLLKKLKEKIREYRQMKDRLASEFISLQNKQRLKQKIIYCSAMIELNIELASKASMSDAPVLITGESGVGKELIAEFIHESSARNKFPFFKINCSMLPPSLIESELFGYEPGSFTGALSKKKPGLVEMAHKGTLFLDEIGEMPLSIQSKLLEFLEKSAFSRVGGTQILNIDSRIICATNRDLNDEVAKNKFRIDLLYRINTIPIYINPLRDRKEDIPLLINHFKALYEKKYNKVVKFSPEVMAFLINLEYPGNVRELKHLIERLIVLKDNQSTVNKNDFNAMYSQKNNIEEIRISIPKNISLSEARKMFEMKFLNEIFHDFEGQKSLAKKLGLHQSTISRKLRKYEVKKPQKLPIKNVS